ncbi:MAG TPA: YdcF family protein [Gemmatimonadaceae bacterium]|nr:YdcF family protein [Gemmatimonadaceae bacterium]
MPRRAPASGIALRVVLGVIATALAIWAVSAIGVVVYSQRDESRPASAIVVLGAAQYVGHPSPVLRARLDHAIALWRAGLAPVLIVTGGRGPRDTTSEGEASHTYALRQGVPDTAILIETHGRTTVESMRAVADMMHDRGMSTAILVSDPFHMLRLKVLASRLGITPYTSPTRTSPISANRAKLAEYVLSESLKVPLTLVLTRGANVP